VASCPGFQLRFFSLGAKFWKGSKIIKAISEGDYFKKERIRNVDTAGTSGISRNSPLTLPSDSDSESGFTLSRNRKRQFHVPTPPELSDSSDSSQPRSKPDIKIAKLFMELKEDIQSIKSKIHKQEKNMNYLDTLKEMFTCLICKEIISENSRPVVLPCCRNAVCCYSCVCRWLEDSPVCPHCRESLNIENCLSQPLLRPIFDMLKD
jgi:hypothetical protein